MSNELLEIDGVRLRVSVRGRGAPLLLVNGVGAALELLDPFRAALTEVESIAVDVPGTGGSETTALPLRLPGYARILARTLDALGFPRVSVLGVSWGGALAQELAHRHGERVDRLILAATSPGWIGVPGKPSALAVLATPRRYTSPSYFERVAPALYGGAVRRNPRLLREQGHLRFIRPPTLRGYLWQLFAVWGWTSLPWLHRLRQPTLILAADDDPIIPLANARLLAWRIPGSRLEVVHEGGHLFLVTHAAAIAALVEEFLKGAGAPRVSPS